jgi:hypothetical protein
MEYVGPRVSTELIPPPISLPLSLPVLFPRMARAVEPIAVQLNRESIGRPAAVHSVTAGWAVGFRQRQTPTAQQVEEGGLEPAQRYPDLAVEDPPKSARTRTGWESRQDRLHLRRLGAVENLSFMTSACQDGLREGPGEIDKCSRHGRHRNSTAPRPVFGVVGASSPDPDTRDAPFTWRQDLRPWRVALDQAPHMGGGPGA